MSASNDAQEDETYRTMETTTMELPHLVILADDEIAQAVSEFVMRRQLSINPDDYDAVFKVTFRQVRGADNTSRLFGSLAITDIKAKATTPERSP